MSKELFYTIFKTPAGWVGLKASIAGLTQVVLPQASEQVTARLLGTGTNGSRPSPERFTDLVERLQAYYSGKKVEFLDELDLSEATPFRREVWRTARQIPYGETRSYGWVAERMGKPKASRAVGQALGRNPLPVVVPCHRVVAGGGGLGGFTGGLEMKKYLLDLEKSA
jgi:methylated-DNA-[protein]-cysteine S-methyltransferase